MAYAIVKAFLRLCFAIAFDIHYIGRENIPKDTPVIYASNHRTNADPPLVGCAVPRRHAFMAKEELFKSRFFGGLITWLGAFPVSRGKGDMGVIDKAVESLQEGRSLFIFPEGTRSKDGKVHKGHSGAALIAARSGKPIVPVGIVFGEKLKFRTKVTVKYGEPINPADYCEICDNPNTRQLVKLKNRYMADIKALAEGGQEAE
ncbi:MAG: 1-acyl-sn-glycerol-3-phosphate acyltransferase [Ruminococcus sp.]|nr:1-acyl-sn-glycerol-3-phosphate acyltransferase [Ruminococcus sp.]